MSLSRDFETRVLPHLDAGYNLARWLLRNDQAAEDAVQEAALRALRYGAKLHAGDARPWWLGIVRNTCFTLLERQRLGPQWVEFDENEFESAQVDAGAPPADPAAQLDLGRQRARVDAALRALSPLLREVVVLREFEDLDYAQIAAVVGAPLGTVMSRLSRARDKLRLALAENRLGT